MTFAHEHRMWIVDQPSPATSAPPTPTFTPAMIIPPPTTTQASPTPAPYPPVTGSGSSFIPGGRLSGILSGVVSLTDILHLFARSVGLAPNDPSEARRQRRRSSSSSMRTSFDQSRGSLDLRELREHRGSIEIRR